MSTVEIPAVREQLIARRRKLEEATARAPEERELEGLLAQVDAALERMESGTFGLCATCHDPIEPDRILADPLVEFCLDHLTPDEQRRLEADLELAAQIQRGLLPRHDLDLDGWQIDYRFQPHGPVAGDFCDVLPLPDGGFHFFLGDVSGKGVAASMLMSHLSALFRTLVPLGLPLGELVGRASRAFCESTLPMHYATLVAGVASPHGEVELASAGHPAPYRVGARGVLEITARGLPLGLFCEGSFLPSRFDVEPGETLFLFTDGLTEAPDPSGDEYGPHRLAAWLASRSRGDLSPSGLLDACLLEEARFRGRARRTDDLTLMVLHRGRSVADA